MKRESMQDPFSRFAKDLTEMYEVVRTVVVVRNRTLYKVEVLEDHAYPVRFKVHFSLQKKLTFKTVGSNLEEEFKKVWVDLTLP